MPSDLDLTGKHGCVQPADGTKQVCSVFATFGAPRLHVGDTVHITHEVYKNDAGDEPLTMSPSDRPEVGRRCQSGAEQI